MGSFPFATVSTPEVTDCTKRARKETFPAPKARRGHVRQPHHLHRPQKTHSCSGFFLRCKISPGVWENQRTRSTCSLHLPSDFLPNVWLRAVPEGNKKPAPGSSAELLTGVRRLVLNFIRTPNKRDTYSQYPLCSPLCPSHPALSQSLHRCGQVPFGLSPGPSPRALPPTSRFGFSVPAGRPHRTSTARLDQHSAARTHAPPTASPGPRKRREGKKVLSNALHRGHKRPTSHPPLTKA